MKVAITGKGGVGKTTLSSTLARLYADEGRTVLAADVDPDANLGLALGLTQEEVDSIVPISKMRTLVEERTGASAAKTVLPSSAYSLARVEDRVVLPTPPLPVIASFIDKPQISKI